MKGTSSRSYKRFHICCDKFEEAIRKEILFVSLNGVLFLPQKLVISNCPYCGEGIIAEDVYQVSEKIKTIKEFIRLHHFDINLTVVISKNDKKEHVVMV